MRNLAAGNFNHGRVLISATLGEDENPTAVDDFPKGATFWCPECDRAGLKAYDTEEKTWRHMDFWQHQTYLTV